MKKILFFFSLILFFSCKKDKIQPPNDLKTRVVLISQLNRNSNSDEIGFISDSIVERYENKRIVEKHFYTKQDIEDEFTAGFRTYSYNEVNLLSKIKFYNDVNLQDDYAVRTQTYNSDGSIQSIHVDKYSPSNFAEHISNYSTIFEYAGDTIKKSTMNHLNNDSITNEIRYLVYGDIDSLCKSETYTSVFDEQNDLIAIKFTGFDPDSVYRTNSFYEYGEIREPLIENVFGSELNLFVIGKLGRYHLLEVSKKYPTKYYYMFPYAESNGNSTEYNYFFDENNRLIEMRTEGSFSDAYNNKIKYFYE